MKFQDGIPDCDVCGCKGMYVGAGRSRSYQWGGNYLPRGKAATNIN